MIWAEIKKALNSTLGAANFKSLDNIITDSKNEINGAISGVNSAISGISGGTNTINNTVNEVKNNIAGITGTINDIQRRATDIQNKTQETINHSATAEQIAGINRNHLENSTYGLNAILNATRSMGGVKSIQRGKVYTTNTFTKKAEDVATPQEIGYKQTIAPVNPTKTLAFCFSFYFCSSERSYDGWHLSSNNINCSEYDISKNFGVFQAPVLSPTMLLIPATSISTSDSGNGNIKFTIGINAIYTVIEFY